MMSKIKSIMMAVVMMACGIAIAGEEVDGLYKFQLYNTAPLVRVRYTGPATTATICWSETIVTQIEDTVTTAITIQNADTIATICTNLMSTTNINARKYWEAVACAGLPADDIDGNDLTGHPAAVSVTDGKWHEVFTVDTTALDYNDVCPWEWTTLKGGSDIILKSIYGAPGGTEPATLTVYVDSEAIWQHLCSTNIPDGSLDNIDISREFTPGGGGLRIPRGSAPNTPHVVIRCDRATATDVGGVGVSFSQDK